MTPAKPLEPYGPRQAMDCDDPTHALLPECFHDEDTHVINLRGMSLAGPDLYPTGSAAERRAKMERRLGKVKHLPMQSRLVCFGQTAPRAPVRSLKVLTMSRNPVRVMRRDVLQIASTMAHS